MSRAERWFLIVMIVLVSLSAPFLHAAEPNDQVPAWSVNLGGVSYHSDSSRSYRSVNPGVGLSLHLTRKLTFGVVSYANSVDRTSVCAAVRWTPLLLPTD